MLGLLLIYSVGKAFYTLAEKHNRSKWLFAILSVVSYYAIQLIFGFILAFILIANNSTISTEMEMGVNFAGIAIGALSVWLFYYLLKRNWERNPKSLVNDDLLDQ